MGELKENPETGLSGNYTTNLNPITKNFISDSPNLADYQTHIPFCGGESPLKSGFNDTEYNLQLNSASTLNGIKSTQNFGTNFNDIYVSNDAVEMPDPSTVSPVIFFH